MNDWDTRGSTDDDYLDPQLGSDVDDSTSGPLPSPHTEPVTFTAPTHAELFDSNTAESESSGPYVPPPNKSLYQRAPRKPRVDPPVSAGIRQGTLSSKLRDRKTAVIVGSLVVAALAVVGAGTFALTNAFPQDSTPLAEAFPETSSEVATIPPAPSTTPPPTAVAPPFCTDPSPGDNVSVTNSAGDRATGPGTIAAFEYHYYVDRDGTKVASTYDPSLQMDPAGIQPYIDKIASDTLHCTTIEPTDSPDKYRVSVALKPSNSMRIEQVDPMLISVAPGPGGWMITQIVPV